MISIVRNVLEAFAAAQNRRARARLAEQLDERTLRDIGLEEEANRARQRVLRPALRFGLY